MSSIYRPDARPCASANGSGRSKGTVSPTVPNAYELLSTEAFGARVSDCRPLDYGECALFRELNLFRHCLLSLFRNTGARAPLFGEPPVALCIVSRMCLVSPGAYVTPYRISRVCACAYILCVYMLCLFSDIYVHRPKGSESLSGSFMRLSRAACAKCSGVNILLRGIWRQGKIGRAHV